jgi:type III pantothenate kinase
MEYIAIDMGNTTCEFALINNGKIIDKFFVKSKPMTIISLKNDVEENFIKNHIWNFENKLCLISSVVPSNNNILLEYLSDYLKTSPKLITHDMFDNSLVNSITPKQEVGLDILCKTLWSKHMVKTKNLILDLGSATVMQYNDENGMLQLVSIGIGLNSMYSSLNSSADLLPKLDFLKTNTLLGKNTIEAIGGGVYFGYIGLLNMFAKKAKQETNCDLLYLTGGRVEILKNDLSFDFIHNQDIIFNGIDIIFNKYFKNM